jgi:hypothetical protein
MTREDHLLVILAEECSEIVKTATKSLRFGLNDCEPGQPESNARRICLECADLQGVLEMLVESSRTLKLATESVNLEEAIKAKKEKVEEFLKYSKRKGRLQ